MNDSPLKKPYSTPGPPIYLPTYQPTNLATYVLTVAHSKALAQLYPGTHPPTYLPTNLPTQASGSSCRLAKYTAAAARRDGAHFLISFGSNSARSDIYRARPLHKRPMVTAKYRSRKSTVVGRMKAKPNTYIHTDR